MWLRTLHACIYIHIYIYIYGIDTKKDMGAPRAGSTAVHFSHMPRRKWGAPRPRWVARGHIYPADATSTTQELRMNEMNRKPAYTYTVPELASARQHQRNGRLQWPTTIERAVEG